jgi:hypothetical protein
MTAPVAAVTTPDTVAVAVAVAVGAPGSPFPHAATRIDVANAIASVGNDVENRINLPDGEVRSQNVITNPAYFASGSGRSWKWIALLVFPFPPSMWNGARVLMEAQRPRPFQPALGSSIRPSSHLA